jgi:hypothetical protein
MPWYKSKVIVGALISIAAKVLVMAGVINDLAPADADNLANLVVLVVGGVGDIVAIGARVAQKHAPAITATK